MVVVGYWVLIVGYWVLIVDGKVGSNFSNVQLYFKLGHFGPITVFCLSCSINWIASSSYRRQLHDS